MFSIVAPNGTCDIVNDETASTAMIGPQSEVIHDMRHVADTPTGMLLRHDCAQATAPLRHARNPSMCAKHCLMADHQMN
ncbi:hypothetical protein [Xanthomonas sp. XNM01]|uniref:hypothetical protein n=1 Tax=Xanthomonas sp. XNM01 TaxID=2769289 RepID=UPI00177EFE24|nr:hypothetical protein [Xanthomonas sp. XNM01]MBD9370965.1 hypothetical protein [Xanthomonas sp. XNM01]